MNIHETKVSFDEFLSASLKLPKSFNSPIGSKASIPKDTELLSDKEGILVYTPVMGTVVHAEIIWRHNISVVAMKLVKILKSMGDIGAKGKFISISVSEREFWIRFNKTRSSIYTVWRKPDTEII